MALIVYTQGHGSIHLVNKLADQDNTLQKKNMPVVTIYIFYETFHYKKHIKFQISKHGYTDLFFLKISNSEHIKGHFYD